ncbi:MAG: hypothetical protein K0R92_1035 [Lachnospiraceae bacterium]|jgi:uncharacterized membrane protein|nr:hypothetical protein [Lachnospiraceae bacterium]
MMIFVWLLIGLALYYFIKNSGISVNNERVRFTPEEILKERYAKGEIDEATFERMLQNLNR